MFCVGEKARADREDFIRKNRKDFDPYSGISDPIEILEIMHRPRQFDPLLNVIPYPIPPDELLEGLSETELRILRNRIMVLWRTDPETAKDLTGSLAAFTEFSVEEILLHLIEKRAFYPSFVFARATDRVRQALLNAERNAKRDERNHLLQALAWARGEEIVETFRSWKVNPPPWSSALLVAPETYSHVAAWEIDDTGKLRELAFADCCFALERAETLTSPITVGLPVDSRCPWCDRPLSAILSADLTDPQIDLLPPTWRQLTVASCPACTCYGHVFTHVDFAGGFEWYSKEPPEYFDAESEWIPFHENVLYLGRRRNPLHAANQFLPARFSQLGGYPCWIQDPEFPSCPSCEQSMPFLAQIDMSDVEQYGEGTYYLFLCADCKIAATGYQQT